MCGSHRRHRPHRTSPPCVELDASSSDSRQSPLPAFGSSKIDRRHLERLAIVYVRQSDPHEVLLHRESKEMQYNLPDRAVSLGWPRERVLIIDEDQGQSATSDASRVCKSLLTFLIRTARNTEKIARFSIIEGHKL